MFIMTDINTEISLKDFEDRATFPLFRSPRPVKARIKTVIVVPILGIGFEPFLGAILHFDN